LAGHHVLFVGETAKFLDSGGVVNFLIQGNTVRLLVSLHAARREDLKISSKLLQIAEVVN
jgi:hypothetical protein